MANIGMTLVSALVSLAGSERGIETGGSQGMAGALGSSATTPTMAAQSK
jgi:hypothetical protein